MTQEHRAGPSQETRSAVVLLLGLPAVFVLVLSAAMFVQDVRHTGERFDGMVAGYSVVAGVPAALTVGAVAVWLVRPRPWVLALALLGTALVPIAVGFLVI